MSSPAASAPPLQALPGFLAGEAALAELLGVDDAVVAVPETARSVVLAALAELSSSPTVLVATATAREADQLVHDLAPFLGSDAVELLPAWETLPFERVSPATETMGRRLRTMWRLRHGAPALAASKAGGARAPAGCVVVAPIRALLQRLGPRVEDTEPVVVRQGGELDPAELVARLVRAGYRREYQVEARGELAVRGGIVDVFGSTAESPVRVDLFGDEVERLTAFDVTGQRSVADLEQVELFGCREVVLTEDLRERARRLAVDAPFARDNFTRIADGELFDGMESWLPWLSDEERLFTDLLDTGSRVVLVEPRRLRDRARELLDEEMALSESLATTWGVEAINATAGMPRLHLGFERLLQHTNAKVASVLPVADSPGTVGLQAAGWPPVLGDSAGFARRLGELAASGNRVVICADGRGSAERMASVLEGEGLSCDLLTDRAPDRIDADIRRPGVHVIVAPLDRGGYIATSKLAIVAEPDVTGRCRPHRAARPRPRPTEGFFDDLAPGDYVVHNVHGVARFAGMVTRSIGGAERDYLQLEYRGGDRLYLPSEQIDAITPYTGGESPVLNRMGGAEWSRQKARVRAAVREVAKELVELYRRRQVSPGHAFAPDTPWQTELEESFAYPETPDQLKAIDDVKADMERDVPMDRLVCGDVGFGKTEVAVRAVFKAVQDGYQAAILVPTTLLAQQHFQTFSDRYAPFPVRVEVLSRFLTGAEARKVVDGLADGSVDVVIGTHRLLTSDVRFKKLGLLVVDEEQRFGVSHKEAIKHMTIGVDVLTLTASPIPRTLEMSLTGIRDLSLITTPPAERQPILTYVGEHDEHAVAEALRRELLREGQIFYVHNRVHDIERVAADLRALVPDARIAVAHGQMDEGTLEQVVLDFWAGEYDVLVCTTIIESGIDMPSVNTLVVDRADRLGLGQLHQLRGRVGRAGRRAYAYLLFPPDRVLSEQAYERLRTIGEHTELGSGFKIAMRDLEIRGAGNLLGRDQSGHIAAVGYDLYVRLVAEAVSELKGEPIRVPVEITVDLPVDAFLPPGYVEREDLRLEAYRRLAEIKDHVAVEDLRNEWLDRYGPLPQEAEALIAVGRLRAECVRTGVTEVTASVVRPGAGGVGRTGEAVARLAPISLKASARVRLTRLHPRAIMKEDVDQLIVPLSAGPDLADRLAVLLSELVPVEPSEAVRVDPDAAAVAAAEALAAGSEQPSAPTI
ncbi:MAG: transcription-repair coupling factor [Acidimicrobiales bacterium]